MVTNNLQPQFEKFGISECEFWNLSWKDMNRLTQGKTIDVTLKAENGEGKTIERVGRLRMQKNPDGSVEMKVYYRNDEVKSDELKLSKNDLEKIQEQGVIYTELNIGGSRNRYFVQLDRETNCLLYEKADRIGQNIPEDIFGVKIDRELRDQIREGKQVTVKSGNKEYTIGIDLLSEGGLVSVKSEKRNSMIDYKEAKKKISIISILRDWGYKFDKSKGKISPNFVLRDEHGKEIDRVIITNPKKSEEQGYWRRDGGKGDLITFIKENLNQFGVVGRNETDTVTKVLAKLMNIEEEKEQKRKEKASADTSEQDLFEDCELDQWLDDNGIREAKEFDLAQWERQYT